MSRSFRNISNRDSQYYTGQISRIVSYNRRFQQYYQAPIPPPPRPLTFFVTSEGDIYGNSLNVKEMLMPVEYL